MICFLGGLRLVEKVNDETASKNRNVTRGAFRATHVHNTVVSSMDEHDLLLYIGAPAAQKTER